MRKDEGGCVHATAASKGPAVVKYLAAQLPAVSWQAHSTQQLSRIFICSVWPVMGSEKGKVSLAFKKTTTTKQKKPQQKQTNKPPQNSNKQKTEQPTITTTPQEKNRTQNLPPPQKPLLSQGFHFAIEQ